MRLSREDASYEAAVAEFQRSLGEAIGAVRSDAGMTQLQLSQATGVSQARISRIESGHCNITVETLQLLADAMNLQLQINFAPKPEA